MQLHSLRAKELGTPIQPGCRLSSAASSRPRAHSGGLHCTRAAEDAAEQVLRLTTPRGFRPGHSLSCTKQRAQDNSDIAYAARPRTPRGYRPSHLRVPRATYMLASGGEGLSSRGAAHLGGESYGGTYGSPKHRDGSVKESLTDHIFPEPRGRIARMGHLTHNLYHRRSLQVHRDTSAPEAKGSMTFRTTSADIGSATRHPVL
uniref:Uncharacterized protein n=1 Tax=Noctiluca scintillans TaxID=2966 RepID=A0A7S1FDL0_NOCSC|mmetsp:Transcript_55664/g.148459  ORF Transcript_55664/g.148459 Transcript_55664/m.148459 type:complete len:203 (+) Transcript_55664:43-651(+)